MYRISKRLFLKQLGLSGSLLAGLSGVSRTARGAENADGTGRLLHGPMLGAASPDSMRIWCRANEGFGVSIAYGRLGDRKNVLKSDTLWPEPDEDLALEFRLSGLAPGTRYWYEILIDGAPDKYLRPAVPLEFQTPGEPGDLREFSVGFGSCARYARDPVQPIWHAVERIDPDLFCWIGDNVYADSGNPRVLAEEYKRQRAVTSFQTFASRVPQLAVWDDHDYAYNDSDRRNPIREQALSVFRNFWANPAYGTEAAPGVFFRHSLGRVDFFFLDVRYYRDPNEAKDGPGKSMLGAGQLDWLRDELHASTAAFKVLVSGSGWTLAKGHGGDSWASFVTERRRLFDFIRTERIGGVVLVSGDTHVAELNAIPWSDTGGYDLYDLTSSPLAQPTTDSWLTRHPERRIRQVYAGSTNFGLLTFDFHDEPALTYNVIDVHGQRVWDDFRIRAAELVNGVASWRNKMDDLSRQRYERKEQGGAYYQ